MPCATTLDPFDASGKLKDRTGTGESETVLTCPGEPSSYARGAGVQACTDDTGKAYRACWPSTRQGRNGRAVWCTNDPWTPVTLYWANLRQAAGTAKTSLPLGVELVDGSRWRPAKDSTYDCLSGCPKGAMLTVRRRHRSGLLLDVLG